MKRQAFAVILSLIAAGFALGAHAAWPERSITIIVPYPPGGTADTVGRIAAEWLAKALKQSVIVEHRPGAGGAIAAEFVARAPADGYTLILASTGIMEIVPRMQKVRYDTLKSFAPIFIVGVQPIAFAVNSTVPVKTIDELVAYAKARPGQVTYASSGNGSTAHLTMALFLKRAGIAMTHVAYKGNAPAMTDLLGGHVPMFLGGVFELLSHYKGAKIKVIAVSSEKRLRQMPEVPTVAEQGYPGFSISAWNALVAPAGTPKEVIAVLGEALRPACQDAGFGAKLEAIGVDAWCNTPEQFSERLKSEWLMWGEAVKASGVAMQ
ncbi:MAG: tripartite tricarboxylate transporter substrate binding protein [Betaproteobacteria bacterium]|nr:tripartite tricarboxylate transporter substrate binding protein [Betaproteobacteria bacterium]